jgi:hypothetical protein
MKLQRALALAFGVGLASVGRAELLYFRESGRAQVSAVVEGPTVRVETSTTTHRVPIEAFRQVVPGFRVSQEWRKRHDEAVALGTDEARFAAAWWGFENGLTAEPEALLRAGNPQSSSHPPTRQVLATLDQLRLPCPEPNLGALRKSLRPARFVELRGRHVVLLHQGNELEARERLEVLEKVVITFFVVFEAQGIRLAPLAEKLVSVNFSDQAGYAAFLRRSGAEPFLTTQGYYHPTLKAVFAYDTRSDPDQQAARRALGNRRRDGASEAELARKALLLELDWRARDLGIAAHETIHQLTVATGLFPRPAEIPHWLQEGLAAQFEVVRGDGWAGVGRANDLRLPDWRSIRPRPRLAPLLRDTHLAHGYHRPSYAEAWALVQFLRQTRPREFVGYLDLLRLPLRDGQAPGDRAFAAFVATFGPDLARLEAGWLRDTDALQTPLEEHEPTAAPSTATNQAESPLARPPSAP